MTEVGGGGYRRGRHEVSEVESGGRNERGAERRVYSEVSEVRGEEKGVGGMW